MHYQPKEPSADDLHIVSAPDLHPMADESNHGGNDALDDVFGDGAEQSLMSTATSSHPSDMRRLQSEHTTAGYREGVTVAKATSVQAGFDEGFSLGATIGLRAGQLLGLLEGIIEALDAHEPALSEATELQQKFLQAQEELSPKKIFSPEYWAADGNWTYPVESKDGDEILFSDVAICHPLVSKWSKFAESEVARWKIDQSVLEDAASARLEAEHAETSTITPSSVTPAGRKPLDW